MPTFFGRLTTRLLVQMEEVYLKAHGWAKVGPDAWDPPVDHPSERTRKRRGITRGHAVNSQKQYLYYDLGKREYPLPATETKMPVKPTGKAHLKVVEEK